MSQSNELLEKVRADRAERAAKRKEQQRRNRLILLGAAGAVVVLTVILCLIFIRPAPVSDPTDQRFTLTPKNMFVLGTVDDAREMYLAAGESDDVFLIALKTAGSYPDLELEQLRKHARDLYDLLRTVPLPSHANGVSAIYYNVENTQLELLYDVNGIRYHFLVNCPRQEYTGTPTLAYGHRFASSYFAMYAKDGKLFADFTASGKTMALCIHTDDISKVDFRDFALRPVAY